ncbi:putative cytochrome P450 [Caenibius tardaugens NBRC 16725]|uniref:Putative cytochrome P450 n=1 Tax=Caenibius tardaugens NBRC 16725 TaxID=1219035 RepID=U2YNS0_9SPHN|nr:cytochrome P450 [Caenibius tardaugens]AZI35049.1 cytochrome P450 [Caenibius tardaugens NBRC 16725]GAD50232.1 putative cytochrome P450 [Caenibius tardaugens NBRC 16725]
MSAAFHFDPFAAEFFEDPFPAFQVMRRDHPVYRREIPNHRVWPHYWMLSRAADVDAALKDWRRFSSAQGTLIDTDITLIPPNMFNMDPPRHDELRTILARVLTPRRVADLEPEIARAARAILASHLPTGQLDATRDYAQLIPTLTMCSLLDLPVSDRELFLRWNLETMAGADFTSPEALRAYGEMDAYWKGIVAERRKHKGSDLISQILHHDRAGLELADEEIAGFCSLLHDASQNTTMNMIANAVIALGRNPDQRRKLTDDPTLWPAAIEELMRFVSPVQGLARATTCDVTLHGVTIPAGDQVLILYGSANHDETVFENPERLDFDRPRVKTHWGFGQGIHTCLGAAVARLEIRVALQVLLDAVPDYTVVESGIIRNQLVPTRGLAATPITFAPITFA